MKIEVAVPKKAATKIKGDLLENIAEKLLEAQNYEVEQEVRHTGVEVDLLCQSKTNNNKKISVECKAYRDTKIDAGILDKMLGVKSRKKYSEAWLITTSSLGKEAKGIMDELIQDGVSDIHICRISYDHVAHIPKRSYALYQAREALFSLFNDTRTI